MFQKQRIQHWNNLSFLTVAVMTVAVLAGCAGQKYGFPGFGSKQAETSYVDNQSLEGQNASESNLATGAPVFHGGDKKPMIAPASASDQKLDLDNHVAGKVHINTLTETSLNNSENEIDQAFRDFIAADAAAHKQELQEASGNYNQLVSQIDQGASSLDALKASFESLEKSNATPRSVDSNYEMSFAKYANSLKQNQPVEASGIIIQPATKSTATESTVATKKPSAFSWATSHKKNEDDKALPEKLMLTPPQEATKSGPVRRLLARSQVLIQNNNLLDARVLAETASMLKKKTQAVFSPEEVTPEQVLAEITTRERKRKEKLLASLDSKEQSLPTENQIPEPISQPLQRNAPVVIDMSQEWMNTATTKSQWSSLDKDNQEQRSIKQSGQQPRLPLIQSGQQPVNQASYGVGRFKRSVWDSQPVQRNATSIQNASYAQSQGALNAEEQIESSDYDEFAADIAGVSVKDASGIELAPLLIDESELTIESVDHSGFSTPMLSLIVCGIAFASFMLIRWRR
ncbi:MAG: hypothetical protein JKY95_02510 [Planctomycetaceae bacterium]|nr:hypothetical protein [Planctomycetaceae bacterium]